MSIAQRMIDYDRSQTITNLEQLPKGTGAKYLECIEGQAYGTYIAAKWRRTPPANLPRGRVLIRF